MNVRVILALTVPVVLVMLIIGAILAEGDPDEGALAVADELLGIAGAVLAAIVAGLLVSGGKDKDGEE